MILIITAAGFTTQASAVTLNLQQALQQLHLQPSVDYSTNPNALSAVGLTFVANDPSQIPVNTNPHGTPNPAGKPGTGYIAMYAVDLTNPNESWPPHTASQARLTGPGSLHYTLNCATLAWTGSGSLNAFTITRVGVNGGPGSIPAWHMYAYDASGTLLSEVGEGDINTGSFLFPGAPQDFTVSSSTAIAHVVFCNNNALSTYDTLPLAGATSPSPPTVAGVSAAPAPPRRALVIGNAAYAEAPLRNPLNDAQALADLLRRLGVEVLLYQNADKPTMEQAVDRFTRGVARGSAGLFFFSGHGVQIDGVNYLVPIGARLEAASDVKYHAVAADWVLARMDESGMDVKLLFLDACRNNPLGRSWTRALNRGLAVMETPQGALLAYATSPGKTASDGTERTSPFTTQLLRELGTPGRDIEVALKAVRAGVQQLTKGEQIPWVASSMTGNFSLAQ
jgi:hypothetical protein